MPAYPPALREEVLRVVASGVPISTAARIVGVSRITVWRWVDAQRRAGRPAPPRRSGKHTTIHPAEEPALRAQFDAMPGATLAQHCARWAQEHGVRVSPPTMLRALARLGLTAGRREPAKKGPGPSPA
jgi:transposase